MATHSSVLVWRIPGTGEPGGLLSLGSHRVRHDWSDLAADLAAFGLRCRMWDLFSCSMWTLSLWHVGSGSLTTDQTQVPCTGSKGSQLLDHQRSPFNNFTKVTLHRERGICLRLFHGFPGLVTALTQWEGDGGKGVRPCAQAPGGPGSSHGQLCDLGWVTASFWLLSLESVPSQFCFESRGRMSVTRAEHSTWPGETIARACYRCFTLMEIYPHSLPRAGKLGSPALYHLLEAWFRVDKALWEPVCFQIPLPPCWFNGPNLWLATFGENNIIYSIKTQQTEPRAIIVPGCK